MRRWLVVTAVILACAAQNIRFQMDERGVRLRSDSHMSMGCGDAALPEPKHIMVFDKPFLILMKRAEAGAPYFALWVGSPELLVRAPTWPARRGESCL